MQRALWVGLLGLAGCGGDDLKEVTNPLPAGDAAVMPTGDNELHNQAPVAALSLPSSLVVGELGSFDASASQDADGTLSNYLWDFGDGTSATTAVVSKSYTSAAVFSVRVTVTDNDGAVAHQGGSVTVTVPDYSGIWAWGLVNEADRPDSGCGPFMDSTLGITVSGTNITIVENPGESGSVSYAGTLTGAIFSATASSWAVTQTIAGTFTSATHFDGTYHAQGGLGMCDRTRAVWGDKQ